MLPNCFILGAPKCATTSLAYYLSQHPDFFQSRVKETCFFTQDNYWNKGKLWYEQEFFHGAKGYPVVCDATPQYFVNGEKVIERLQIVYGEKAKSLKFIVLIRDPVDRAWSHYQHMCRVGFEDLSFEGALAAEDERVSLSSDAWIKYYREGLYGEHYSLWLQYFNAEQFLFIKQSDLHQNLKNRLEEVCAFLGIDTAAVESISLDRQNVSAEPRYRHLMRILAGRFPGAELLKKVTPMYYRRKLLERLRVINTSSTGAKDKIPLHLEAELRGNYLKDIELMESISGLNLSEWKLR